MNAPEKILRELVVTCGDGTKVLEFIEEALDEIALAIECEVAGPWRLAVGLWWNHRSNVALSERVEQRVGVVGLITNQGMRIGIVEQQLGASQIVGLPRREPHLDRIAEGIDEGVDFGGQSAARSADRLLAVFFRAPALCW